MHPRALSILLSGIIVFTLATRASGQRSATGHERQTATTALSETRTVIENFWTGLGELDPVAIKQTLGWPVSIVETSASQTTNPLVLMTPLDFDKEFMRSSHRPASGRSEFYGAKLQTLKVQMLNGTLALVTYVCQFPRAVSEPKSRRFNAVTILFKDQAEANSWKIIFITVPK